MAVLLVVGSSTSGVSAQDPPLHNQTGSGRANPELRTGYFLGTISSAFAARYTSVAITRPLLSFHSRVTR